MRIDDSRLALRQQIDELETKLGDLKRLILLEEAADPSPETPTQHIGGQCDEADGSQFNDASDLAKSWNWPLQRDEYKRYGRQMIMPEVGLQGELSYCRLSYYPLT